MKLIGLFIIILGGILIWFTSLPQFMAWILIIIGFVILIIGFILKTEAS
jgi:hypothetical protein